MSSQDRHPPRYSDQCYYQAYFSLEKPNQESIIAPAINQNKVTALRHATATWHRYYHCHFIEQDLQLRESKEMVQENQSIDAVTQLKSDIQVHVLSLTSQCFLPGCLLGSPLTRPFPLLFLFLKTSIKYIYLWFRS